VKLNELGLLVVISGPSGVGKGTVRKALFEMTNHNLYYSISMTTRKPRVGERDGIDYIFTDEKDFKKRINQNKFLEHAEFVGQFYGTPIDKVKEMLLRGNEVVLEIEVEGAKQVREKMPEAVFIFIAPPSRKVLYDRLLSRGTESKETIIERMEKAEREFKLAHTYDYIVVNDEVANAADRIMAIIRAEHAKTERSIYKYNKLLEL